MKPTNPLSIEERVAHAAEAALHEHQFVSTIDLATGLGWLPWNTVEFWKRGRVPSLTSNFSVSAEKFNRALKALEVWASRKGLIAAEVPYQRLGRDGSVNLRFCENDDPRMEKLFQLRYLSATMSEKEKVKSEKPAEPVVFILVKDSACSDCGKELDKGDFLFMDGQQPLCLACARFDELVFQEAGDAALTRRSGKYSAKKAVVVKFSRSRGRYERQGLLVEAFALEKAEQECSEDAGERAGERKRAEVAREKDDEKLAAAMARRILELFPGCPPEEAIKIAQHTATRGSGRVGRSAAGRALDDKALTLAVRAAVRHHWTDYDDLLAHGMDRELARGRVSGSIEERIEHWRR